MLDSFVNVRKPILFPVLLLLALSVRLWASDRVWIEKAISIGARDWSESATIGTSKDSRFYSKRWSFQMLRVDGGHEPIELKVASMEGEWGNPFSLENKETRRWSLPRSALRLKLPLGKTVELSLGFWARPKEDERAVEVLERKHWGAREPKGKYRRHRPNAIVIHHSWRPAREHYREISTISGIQRYHMYSAYTGWDDIGYHYLIGPEGIVYKGRPESVIGAHCVPNTGKVGICLIGNYDQGYDPIDPETWQVLEKLVLEIASRNDIPPDRLYGHRDFSSKSCPGYEVYRRLWNLQEKFDEIGFTLAP